MGQWLQTALAEAAGGATAGLVADTVLYAMDSAKVRAQSPSAGKSSSGVRILFRGLAPTVLLGSVPVFGSFFLLYAPLRDALQSHSYSHCLPVASAICAAPATVIGVPADVVKKRLVLGIDANASAAIRNVTADSWRGLFAGWHVNLLRDLPFAGIKIGLYELFAHQYQTRYLSRSSLEPITPAGAAFCGIASGICCAFLTCPLDVVNTRIKSGSETSCSISTVMSHILKEEGFRALFRGVGMRSVVLGIGSCIFWPIQRTVAQTLHPHRSWHPTANPVNGAQDSELLS